MSIPTVNSFRLSHEAILDVVAQLQGLTRSYLQAKPLLLDLSERLLAYFNRQDREFYRDLSVFFAEDRAALKILEFLELDLKDLKIQYLVFFEKHSGELGDVNSRNFVKDFREFSGAVIARVKMEEDRLMPLLKRRTSNDEPRTTNDE